MGHDTSSRFIKAAEVSRILGLSPTTIRTAIRNGDIPGIRVGVSYLVEREALERLLAEVISDGHHTATV